MRRLKAAVAGCSILSLATLNLVAAHAQTTHPQPTSMKAASAPPSPATKAGTASDATATSVPTSSQPGAASFETASTEADAPGASSPPGASPKPPATSTSMPVQREASAAPIVPPVSAAPIAPENRSAPGTDADAQAAAQPSNASTTDQKAALTSDPKAPPPSTNHRAAHPDAPLDASSGAQVAAPAQEKGSGVPDATHPRLPDAETPEQPGPIIATVRRLLPTMPTSRSVNKADRAAAQAFYLTRGAKPIWTDPKGLTARGKQAIAEMRKADDWGLSASSFVLPSTVNADDIDSIATAEIQLAHAALTYARHARGGRINPQAISNLIDRTPTLVAPAALLNAAANADDVAAYLRSLHPQHPQFETLRQALLALRAPDRSQSQDPKPVVTIPHGPLIRPGQSHLHVALVRQRLKLPASDGQDVVYDDALVKAVKAFQRKHRQSPDGIIGRRTRAAFNGVKMRRPDKADRMQRLIVNMERWRWMPRDLGELYVWANVTEQRTRVYKGDRVLFAEKIIVGKPKTPTVEFSSKMLYVIFHPSWGVPKGIKNNELAPHLRRASSNGFWFFGGGRSAASVLRGFGGLVATYNGRPINPNSVNWQYIDINRVSFRQPPGPKNVLGVVKFRFPNKHDIYMHDTPERHLFNGNNRAFSHGCMRVQHPMRLAQVLLAEDKGWSPSYVNSMVNGRSSTTSVTLDTPIPVHVAYFTATPMQGGRISYPHDLYGLDSKIASSLAGRSVHLASHAASSSLSRSVDATVDPYQYSRSRRISQRRSSRRRVRRTNPNANNPFYNLFGP